MRTVRLPLPLPPREDKPVDLLAVGLNSLDLVPVVTSYPPVDGKAEIVAFSEQPGGQTATAAVAAARLGWRVAYVGRVGDDRHGALAVAALRDAGVDVADVRVVAGAPSRFAVVIVERGTGARTVLWHRDPRIGLQPGDVSDALAARARVLHGDDQDPVALAAIARRARALGARTVVDVEAVRSGVDVLLAQIDVVIATAHFAEAYTGRSGPGEAIAALQATCGAPVVCVTLGEEGSLARCEGHEIRTPGFQVPVVDTTGAGDVFRAGFIAGWLRGGADVALEDVLRYANAAAALACRAVGAMAAAPAAADVDALLRGEAM
jgi:sulfofructose kinase